MSEAAVGLESGGPVNGARSYSYFSVPVQMQDCSSVQMLLMGCQQRRAPQHCNIGGSPVFRKAPQLRGFAMPR